MTVYTFSQLVDLATIQGLLESHHRLSGMAYCLMDAEENVLVCVGRQEICERFHRVNPVSGQCCIESNAYLQAHACDAEEGGQIEHCCGNGMINVALPLVIDGEHMATLIVSQFFYDHDPPDRELFYAQALTLGFDPEDYLAALEKVSVFSLQHVHDNLLFLRNMLNDLADTGSNNLRRIRQMEERNLLLGVALDNTKDAVCLLDMQYRFVYVNASAYRNLGYSLEELLTMTPLDIDPDVTPEMLEKLKGQMLSSGLPIVFEGRVRAKDGRIFPVEVSICLFEHDGAKLFLSVSRDITERKRAEDLLNKREQEFRAMIENSPDPIARFDPAGRFLYVNPAFEKLIGMPSCLLLGRALDGISTETSSAIAEPVQQAICSALNECASKQVELSWREHNGSIKCYHFRIVPESDNDGSVVSILNIGRNVSLCKQTEKVLNEQVHFLHQLLDSLPIPVFYKDVNGVYRGCNEAFASFVGLPKDMILDRSVFDLAPKELAEVYHEADAALLHHPGVQTYEDGVMHGDGTRREVIFNKANFSDADGRVAGIVGAMLDITERKRAEDLLHKREQEFRAMIENSPDPVIRYDREGRRIYINPAFEKLMGKPAYLLLGKTPSEMPAGGDAGFGKAYQQTLDRVIGEGAPADLELSWNDEDGLECCHRIRFVPEFDQEGAVSTVLCIGRDVSSLRAHQRQLHDLAYYDNLTGLPNRVLFLDRLRQAVAEVSQDERRMVGLMLLDLDRFKAVNDSFGHHVGDKLLCAVGKRLLQKVRDCDIVARLGGDEFAIILPNLSQREALGTLAGTLLGDLSEPFDIEGKLLNVTATIGIASCPDDSRDASELVQLADTAMYHARSMGRNHFLFCSAELTASVKQRLSLEADLCNALKQEEFELYYQPKMNLASGEIVGAEALLRWQHPEMGVITPDRFIELAEETGMIIDLGEWVLRSACSVICELNQAENGELKVAVNLSVRQFDKDNLVETVRSILAETRCRAEWLVLEITESLLLEERDDILTKLEELRRMGCSIAMDDFGTGYSALGYLAKFPINTLKIDRSFVDKIFEKQENALLVKAIVSLAQALGLTLVAEGVETCEQARFLKDIGCSYAQGYLFSKPVPEEQFRQLIRDEVIKMKTEYRDVLNRCSIDISSAG